jgi:hypothetical protein
MHRFLVVTVLAPVLLAQHGRSASTFGASVRDQTGTIEITNTRCDIGGSGLPVRPTDERMIRRTTTSRREGEASTVVEAWPLCSDLRSRPLYSIKVKGADPAISGGSLLVIPRGSAVRDL